MINYNTPYYKFAESEMEMLAAYNGGRYCFEYSDAYRHCFRVAKRLAFGLW